MISRTGKFSHGGTIDINTSGNDAGRKDGFQAKGDIMA